MRSADAFHKKAYKPRVPYKHPQPEDWREIVRRTIRAKAPKLHALNSGWCRGDFLFSGKNHSTVKTPPEKL